MSWVARDPNVPVTVKAPPGPAPTFGELHDATVQQYDAQQLSTTRDHYAGRLGQDVVGALAKEGITGFTNPAGKFYRYDDQALRKDYTYNPAMEPHIWADVASVRASDPSFLSATPDAHAFEGAIIKARQADYAESSQVLAAGGRWTGLAAGLTGGVAAMVHDPLQLGIAAVTAPIGGPVTDLVAAKLGVTAASSFAKRFALGSASEAAINAGMTAATIPVKASNSAEIGVDYTAGDAAADIGSAALFGAAVHGAKAAGGALLDLPNLPGRLVDNPVTVRRALNAIGAIKPTAADPLGNRRAHGPPGACRNARHFALCAHARGRCGAYR